MLKPVVDSRLLVGPETMDDAAVVQLSTDLAIVLTTDFITPVVDDPLDWGWIAAANSVSDIFAMGARPVAALNVLAWSKSLPQEMLGDVLVGGQAAAEAAGCMIVGGHTIQDKEPKYGLAVVGTVHPDRIVRNRGAQPGDILFLSKALGAGAVTTAMRADAATPEEIEAVVRSMRVINRGACEAALAASVRAMTDVTGFGLAGHLTEMLGPDGPLGVRLRASALPVLPGALRHILAGRSPCGAHDNRQAYQSRVRTTAGVPAEIELLLFDPQTSGGLLAAIPPEHAGKFREEAARHGAEACAIGEFTETGAIDVVGD
jgi:selenide,water dikinase